MKQIVLRARVSDDGMLHLKLPADLAEANAEVLVTVQSLPPPMSQEEWRELIQSTAGKWEGEFERPEQGEYEEREPLP